MSPTERRRGPWRPSVGSRVQFGSRAGVTWPRRRHLRILGGLPSSPRPCPPPDLRPRLWPRTPGRSSAHRVAVSADAQPLPEVPAQGSAPGASGRPRPGPGRPALRRPPCGPAWEAHSAVSSGSSPQTSSPRGAGTPRFLPPAPPGPEATLSSVPSSPPPRGASLSPSLPL